MRIRHVLAGLVVLALLSARPAGADKIDELTHALIQDASYKVRVQAALVLGKLADKRAVPALSQALSDENESVRGVAATSLGRIGDPSAANALLRATNDPSEFVRTQAKKALELVSGGSSGIVQPAAKAGARFYLAVGFQGAQRGGPEYGDLIRSGLTRELAKLPNVTLNAGGEPTAAHLSSKKLQGFIVDGTIERLSSSKQGGQVQIDCDVKAFVATFPQKSIKMMTTEGASLQVGGGPSQEIAAKKDCLAAAVEAVREDVGKFLKTVQ